MNMSFCAFALRDLGGVAPCLTFVYLLEKCISDFSDQSQSPENIPIFPPVWDNFK